MLKKRPIVLKLFYFSALLCPSTISDWIEMPTVTKRANQTTQILSNSDIFNSFLLENTNGASYNPIKLIESNPSPEWLEYQRVRFNSSSVVPSNSTKKLTKTIIVTANSQQKKYPNDRYDDSVQELPIMFDSQKVQSEGIPLVVHANKDDKLITLYESTPSVNTANVDSITSVKSDKKLKSTTTTMKPVTTSETFQTTEKPNFTNSSTLSYSSFQGFLNFVKNIQHNIVSSTTKTIKEKINYLKRFRDDLLINIEDRINGLWPKTPIKNRSKRGIFNGNGGESAIEFPSAETALMTINFLTFAVFLIKLVLQVISTVKAKHYTMNGLNVNTLEAIKVSTRKKRNTNNNLHNHTPDYLDEIYDKMKFL